MLVNIPLLLAPLVAYNIHVYVLATDVAEPWDMVVFGATMLSGAEWFFTLGDLMISISLFLLFFEIIKATRSNAGAITDHLLSTILLVVFIVEFIAFERAATSVFFVLLLMQFIDVVAGFSISIRTARRDIAMGAGGSF